MNAKEREERRFAELRNELALLEQRHQQSVARVTAVLRGVLTEPVTYLGDKLSEELTWQLAVATTACRLCGYVGRHQCRQAIDFRGPAINSRVGTLSPTASRSVGDTQGPPGSVSQEPVSLGL